MPDEVRTVDRSLLGNRKLSDETAVEFGKKWRDTGDAASENVGLLALLEGRFGTSGIAQHSVDGLKAMFEFYGVSAHYLIDRSGVTFELVAPHLLAFHAGKSKLPSDGRESVNQFSIGVELIANPTEGFTAAQMNGLAELTNTLMQRYPINSIYGHSDIAPQRKTDPWGFIWRDFLALLKKVPSHHSI